MAGRSNPISEVLREAGRGGSPRWLGVMFAVGLVAELTLFDSSVGEALATAFGAVILVYGVMLVTARIRRRSGDQRADAVGALVAVGVVALAVLLTLFG